MTINVSQALVHHYSFTVQEIAQHLQVARDAIETETLQQRMHGILTAILDNIRYFHEEARPRAELFYIVHTVQLLSVEVRRPLDNVLERIGAIASSRSLTRELENENPPLSDISAVIICKDGGMVVTDRARIALLKTHSPILAEIWKNDNSPIVKLETHSHEAIVALLQVIDPLVELPLSNYPEDTIRQLLLMMEECQVRLPASKVPTLEQLTPHLLNHLQIPYTTKTNRVNGLTHFDIPLTAHPYPTAPYFGLLLQNLPVRLTIVSHRDLDSFIRICERLLRINAEIETLNVTCDDLAPADLRRLSDFAKQHATLNIRLSFERSFSKLCDIGESAFDFALRLDLPYLDLRGCGGRAFVFGYDPKMIKTYIPRLLRHCPNIHTLCMDASCFPTVEDLHLLRQFPNLRSLEVSPHFYSEMLGEDLLQGLLALPLTNLTVHLDIASWRGNDFWRTRDRHLRIPQGLKTNTTLQRLKLHISGHNLNWAGKGVLRLISQCTSLRTLNLMLYQAFEITKRDYLEVLEKNSRLENIAITINRHFSRRKRQFSIRKGMPLAEW